MNGLKLALASLTLGCTVFGCELVASVDRSQIAQSASATGSGGAGAQGGGGGTAQGGGGSSQGGGGMGGGCMTADDCPGMDTACSTRTCTAGACDVMLVADGTALPAADQTTGDCKVAQCDGAGMTKSVDDDADVLDDGTDCTVDSCVAGMAMNVPTAPSSACSDNGGKVCDGAGVCVECVVDLDCGVDICQGNSCVSATCGDLKKDGTETDVDCGGSCGPCADLLKCVIPADCQSGVCTTGTCAVPTCTDSVDNGTETDVDCGGACATKCGPGQGCTLDGDCVGGDCSGTTCNPSCTDLVKNANESDVDCGGADCAKCADLLACGSALDCQSNVCTANVCQVPTCSDTAKNAAETDIDCGGGTCAGCAIGQACNVNSDCLGMVCTANVCAPSCTDGIKNGAETDIDCGGGTCSPCADNKTCSVASDCLNGVCTGTKCQAALCVDGVKNGTETGVDCGGPCPICGDQHVLISEIRIQGPAGLTDDFVELYNPTGSDIVLDATWKLEMRGASYVSKWVGTGATLPSHKHYLIGANAVPNAPGYTTDAVATPADATMISGGAKDGDASFRLFQGATIVDAVCYWNTPAGLTQLKLPGFTCEGTPVFSSHDGTVATDQDYSLERKPGGALGNGQDTNNNTNDFVESMVSPSNPQNLASPATP